MLSRSLVPILALALVPLAACRSLPTPRGSAVQTLYDGPLERAAPVDVVVAPVENRSSGDMVPLDLLRESFQKALVKRRYSPLAIEYVDQSLRRSGTPGSVEGAEVTEASYRPGSLGEDAVLRVIVQSWDDSLFSTHATITAELDAYMVDASGGPELWAGRLSKRVNLTSHLTRAATDRLLMGVGCDLLAEDLLAAMPARTAKPGRP
jgi:hypothetical protein